MWGGGRAGRGLLVPHCTAQRKLFLPPTDSGGSSAVQQAEAWAAAGESLERGGQ